MKNSKLVEEAKQNPGRIYHRPHDVLRDRRLGDADRLEILSAWEDSLCGSDGVGSLDGPATAQLEQLRAARLEIEKRFRPQNAAE